MLPRQHVRRSSALSLKFQNEETQNSRRYELRKGTRIGVELELSMELEWSVKLKENVKLEYNVELELSVEIKKLLEGVEPELTWNSNEAWKLELSMEFE